jgi:lipopolysaccharide transport system permease protein
MPQTLRTLLTLHTPTLSVKFTFMSVAQATSSRTAYPTSPLAVFSCLWVRRQLIMHLARREVLSRYRGSFVGVLWSFVNPLVMLAIYTLVMGYFLHARWAGAGNSLQYSIVLFSGLILFNFLSECLTRAPGLVLANPNYVRKIVFPLEVLPWVAICAALFHTALSLVAWVVFDLIVYHTVHPTILFLPLIVAPLALVAVGLSWFLSAAGVFIRDVAQAVTLAVQALMFLSPLFYEVKTVPPVFQRILLANPLTFVIEQARAIMIGGGMPNFVGLGIYWLASLLVAWLGFVWFQRARDGFADVM